MESAKTRKRKSCSEESELSTSSTQVKTRRLENPTSSENRVSTTIISVKQLASDDDDPAEPEEHGNEATTKSTCDRSERIDEVAVEESTVSRQSRLESSMLVADEFKRSFLANVENMRKQFVDKYNFDIVKDEPLEGSYEWVRIDQDKP